MVFQIELAGIVINIETKYMTIRDSLKDYIVTEKKPLFSVVQTNESITYEWRQHPFFDGDENSFTKIGIEPLLERNAICRIITEKLLEYNIIMMHGVVVSDGKNAYMFTAPSGTGKTTRGKILIESIPNMFILNGDKPLLKVEKDKVVACGSPWNGKEQIGVNKKATLKAIFFLERNEKTEIEEVRFHEAYNLLLQQVRIPTNTLEMKKTLQIINSLKNKVRLFNYRSEPTPESVMKAYYAAQ